MHIQLDGNNTMNENIADNGGLLESFNVSVIHLYIPCNMM